MAYQQSVQLLTYYILSVCTNLQCYVFLCIGTWQLKFWQYTTVYPTNMNYMSMATNYNKAIILFFRTHPFTSDPSETLLTQLLDHSQHTRKISDCFQPLLSGGICKSFNTPAYLGSLAKVPIPVQSINPCQEFLVKNAHKCLEKSI